VSRRPHAQEAASATSATALLSAGLEQVDAKFDSELGRDWPQTQNRFALHQIALRSRQVRCFHAQTQVQAPTQQEGNVASRIHGWHEALRLSRLSDRIRNTEELGKMRREPAEQRAPQKTILDELPRQCRGQRQLPIAAREIRSLDRDARARAEEQARAEPGVTGSEP